WYEVIAGGTQISVTAEAEQIFWVASIMAPVDCANGLGNDVTLEPCVAGSFVIDTVPGETYWIIALPTTYSGPVAEFRYILNISGLEEEFIPSEFPDIALSATELDLGDILIGTEGQSFVTVQNIGLLQLDLTCAVAGTDFSVMPTALNLPYMAEDDLVVSITPLTVGTFVDTVTIASNDPDDPVVTVALTCTGVDSPVINVSPASFDVALVSGSSADYPLTISNTGPIDLNYSIEIASPSKSTVQFGDIENNDIVASGQVVPIASLPWTEQTISIGNTTDIDATSSHGSASGLNVTSRGEQIFGDTSNVYGPGGDRNRGNFFYCDTSTTLLEHRFYLNATAADDMWFLVYEGNADIGTYNLISSAQITGAGPGEGWYSSGALDVPLTAGNYYILTTYWVASSNYYNQQGITPFPIDTEFGQLVTACGWAWGFTSGVPPVTSIDVPADPFSGDPIAYHQAVVTGSGTSWLSVAPASGTVLPAGSDDVTVTFDATGLCDGLYNANIVVSSNDLITPVVTVPASLTVTGGVPEIDVTEVVDFGDTYLFDFSEQTVTVTNVGCTPLDITSIATTGDFSASEAAALLAPDESLELIVTFFPLTLGAHTGTLTFTSNDPVTPSLVIDLSGNSIEAPVVGATPNPMDVSVDVGNNGSAVLTVTNSGGSDLDFTAEAILSRGDRASYEYTPHAKGEKDLNVGGRGSGGPDLFGYSWIDSDEAGGPVYDWVDATVGTMAFDTGDDSSNGPFALGFDFDFYGQTFNSVLICSNGFISFTSTATSYSNGMFPDAASPLNCLAPFWDDLNPTDGGTCYVLAEPGRFIIQYDAFVPYGGAGGPSYTFQVILNIDGSIIYQYASMLAPLESATVGMQNGDGTDGLMIAYNAPYIHDGLAIEISATPPWMVVTPEIGTVIAGGSFDLAVDFNSAELEPGDYLGSILIATNDPVTPQLSVPVTLTVGAPVGVGSLPTAYTLKQNMPNPFNPSTTIKFALPVSGHVNLDVYDIAGRLVRTLVNEEMEATDHSVVWNGRDNDNRQVASGVYYYRLSADDFNDTRKMMLVK
ncbi:MAG: choice-of-anchor D domain-containing protein, partial [bacterium]|nr:choice-of-anchor D domain-containing protein [bacterium]